MKITRRFLLCLLLGVFISTVSLGDAQTPRQKSLIFVGTYTHDTASKGIYAFEFDADTGKLTPKGLAAQTSNPSWVAIHPSGKFLYAANESGKESAISAFSIDAKFAKLTLLNQLPALGEDPCYLSFDKTGKYLFVANYTSGNVVVFPILADGKLGPATGNVKDTGTLGPNKERQDGPHAHWIGTSENNRLVYVADLGMDRMLIYKFEVTDGTLSATNDSASEAAAFKPGTGPRHVAFSTDRTRMYALGELDSTMTVFAVKHDEQFSPIQTAPMLPAGFSSRNDAAELEIHPSGKFLYASNRGEDSIVIFKIAPKSGRLALIAEKPTGGKEPRHFALDPTGQSLLAENQNSNNIVIFRINPSTGALSQVSKTDGIPSPVCLVFLPEP